MLRPRSGCSGVPTSSAGRARRPSARGRCASQSKPSSLASSPAWILIRPTSSRVSRSRAKRQRAGDVDRADDRVRRDVVTTVCPARTWTLAPAAGTAPPSQVAGADHGPLRAERIRLDGAASNAAGSPRARSPARGARPRIEVAKKIPRRKQRYDGMNGRTAFPSRLGSGKPHAIQQVFNAARRRQCPPRQVQVLGSVRVPTGRDYRRGVGGGPFVDRKLSFQYAALPMRWQDRHFGRRCGSRSPS